MSDFLFCAVQFGGKPDAMDRTIGREASRMNDGRMRHRDDRQHGRPDAFGPILWQEQIVNGHGFASDYIEFG